jgi:hypothetical protein
VSAPASLLPEAAPALASKLAGRTGGVLLYGTTPPRATATPGSVDDAARTLAARTAALPLDGLLVYDLQDEPGRIAGPRPFPFFPVMDSGRYGRVLRAATGRECVVYKCIGTMDEEAWRAWLREAGRRHGVQLLTPVGRPSARGGPFPLPVTEALRIAVQEFGMVTGGVAIAERHARTGREALRMAQKTEAGCAFFVSQTIYDPDAMLRLLADYAQACRVRGLEPARVVLSFAPCGSAKTLAFLKWLGVAVPRHVQASMLGAASPLDRSLALCRANLERILSDGCAGDVPLGVSVESVSSHRDGIKASIDLAQVLNEVLADHGRAPDRGAPVRANPVPTVS